MAILVSESTKSEHLNGIYQDIAENISLDVALLIYEHYKGLQITFPTRLYSPDYVRGKVNEAGKNANFKELARKYGYSERWIRRMLDNEKT